MQITRAVITAAGRGARQHPASDTFPVAQFEKLWGDLTSLPDLPCASLAVPRLQGQQLKDAAQLDGWVTDGSRDHVESLCAFPR